jgi:hypothetical protein
LPARAFNNRTDQLIVLCSFAAMSFAPGSPMQSMNLAGVRLATLPLKGRSHQSAFLALAFARQLYEKSK